MNILIIAKFYHAKQSARAIQMRRVISALLQYTDHNFILITQGEKKKDLENNNFQLINIPAEKVRFSFIEKITDRLICSPFCLKDNDFIVISTRIANELAAHKRIDLLLTVSTPVDSHIAGLKLKEQNPSLKWLTFFSDLWPSSLLPSPHLRKKLLSVKEFSLMSRIVNKCDTILSPSEYTLDIIKRSFNTTAVLHQIQHCSNISRQKSDESDEVLKGYIIHAGFFSKERIKEDLVIAVNQLVKENSKFKGLIHIGRFDQSLKKLIKKHNCKAIFLLEELPEQLVTKIQKLIEISIIIEAPMNDTSPFMPSKITDSLNNSKKVIVISPVNSFLNHFSLQNKGLFSCVYEVNAIKKCINEAIQSNEEITIQTLEYFHPKTVSNKYDEIFN
jgi:glycosyltransferase involved in cell wall biosynthesis